MQKQSKGQSLTEFALLLPVLIIVVMGVVEVAHIYQAYVTITNAAREGARYGIANPTDIAGIKSHAVQEGSAEIPLSTANVSDPTCASPDGSTPKACSVTLAGDRITVTVTYTYHFITTYLFGIGSMNISNTATMAITNGLPQ
jgi:Flp pilus assembly protein TadG